MAIGQAVDKLGPAATRCSRCSSMSIPTATRAAHLADYVPFFHSRLLGLTGDAAQIRHAARLYRSFTPRSQSTGAAEYTVIIQVSSI